MPHKSGVVEKVFENKAVYIDGERYGQYNPFSKTVLVGDEVSFDYTEKESKGRVYKNIVEKTFTVVSSSSAGAVAGVASGTTGGRSARDNSIERQNCLGHSTKIHTNLIDNNILVPGVDAASGMVTDWDDLALSVVQLAERLKMYVEHGLPKEMSTPKLYTGGTEDGSD